MGEEQLIYKTERMAQLSVAYIKAVASYCGFGADVPNVDHDSVDITVSSSATRKPKIDIQLKATTTINSPDQYISFSLPIKNYNDLRAESMCPRLLVVLCLPENPDEWIGHTSEELVLRTCLRSFQKQSQKGKNSHL